MASGKLRYLMLLCLGFAQPRTQEFLSLVFRVVFGGCYKQTILDCTISHPAAIYIAS